MEASVKLYESKALRDVTGPAIRPGGLALTERALKFCGLPSGVRVLDVGCGNAETVAHLRCGHDLQAVGLDFSQVLLAEGRCRSSRPPLIRGLAEVLPVAGETMTAVFCECLLSLLATPRAALTEFYRVLLPGGYVIVSDLYAKEGDAATHTQGRSACCLDGAMDRAALQVDMAYAGFDVLLFEDHTSLLKKLAAQLVWSHGSIKAFWSAAGFSCNQSVQPGGGRPGYYLMVAVKR